MDWAEYNNWFKQHYQREIKNFVSFIIHELEIDYQARILEIGSGPGWASIELARRMPETVIIAVENNRELLAIAQQNASTAQITNIEFQHCISPEKLNFASQSFDCVLSFKTVRTWLLPLKVFNEIERLIKKDGKYALTDYRRDLNLLARFSIWFTSRTMSPEFRSYWTGKINNSYSLEEIVKTISLTKLEDWKIRTTLFDFLIYKN